MGRWGRFTRSAAASSTSLRIKPYAPSAMPASAAHRSGAGATMRCSAIQPPAHTPAPVMSRLGHRIRRSRSTTRSEEHTSELQSRLHLVCRLLLEKKKKKRTKKKKEKDERYARTQLATRLHESST